MRAAGVCYVGPVAGEVTFMNLETVLGIARRLAKFKIRGIL